MNYLTIEDKIQHCKTSIKVCQEKIEIEGHNGSEFWIKFKNQWEIQLEKLEESLKYNNLRSFKNNSSSAYNISYKNNWLKIFYPKN